MQPQSGGIQQHASTVRRTIKVLAVICLVLIAGCSTATNEATQTSESPTTTQTVEPTTTATPTDSDNWEQNDPNPQLADPDVYRQAYESLVEQDQGLADEFNSVVAGDGEHSDTEMELYSVLPGLSPELQTLVAGKMVESGEVTATDAGTANLLRYMEGSEHHEVTPEIKDALENGAWEDPDGDRLVTPIEDVVGTDPQTMHSDNDMYTDSQEVLVLPTVGLENPHPTEDDVYFEIDSAEGTEFYDVQRDAIVEAFAESDEPIHLHFLENGADTDLEPLEDIDDWEKAHAEDFDNKGKGVHHGIFTTESIEYGQGTQSGLGAPGMFFVANDPFDFNYPGGDPNSRMLPVHEVGHSVGLIPGDFDGIDSTEYSMDEYPSAMNYNAAQNLDHAGIDQYSQGTGHDDFEDMKEERYGESSIDTFKLDEKMRLIWEDPEQALEHEKSE